MQELVHIGISVSQIVYCDDQGAALVPIGVCSQCCCGCVCVFQDLCRDEVMTQLFCLLVGVTGGEMASSISLKQTHVKVLTADS